MKNLTAPFILLCVPLSMLHAQEADQWLDTFTANKLNEAKQLSSALEMDLPREFSDYQPFLRERDWTGLRRHHARVRKRVGQYSDITSAELRTPIWSGPMLELSSVAGMMHPDATALEDHHHRPEQLQTIGRELLRDLPDGAIFLGGTDSGRFCTQLVHDLGGHAKVHIITQNALADDAYMELLRLRFGKTLKLPNKKTVTAAFNEFANDVSLGRHKPRGKTSYKNNRMQVQGVGDVMRINGILVKQIIEANPKNPVYVEQSYVIPWMMPHLRPHRDIFVFHREAQQISAADAKAAVHYWRKRLEDAGQRPGSKLKATRNHYAKCCNSHATVLAYRDHDKEAEKLFRMAHDYAPGNAESSTRLLTLLIGTGKFEEATRFLDASKIADPTPWKLSINTSKSYWDAMEDTEQQLRKQGERADRQKRAEAFAYTLALAQHDRVGKHLPALLAEAGEAAEFKQILQRLRHSKLRPEQVNEHYREVLQAQKIHAANDPNFHLETCYLHLRKQNMEAAMKSCEAALRIPGKQAEAAGAFFAAKQRLRPLFEDDKKFETLLQKLREDAGKFIEL